MSKNSDINEYLGILENEYATIASEGSTADVSGLVDTGSYVLNALYSGSIFGGMPSNKINAIAGEEATGKTYVALGIAKHFLDTDKKALVMLFESEGSVTKEILENRDIDPSRVLIIPVETVQQFATQALRVVQKHLEKNEKDRRPLMFILDSLGMLSTSKELADSESGKDVKDMTRSQAIKAAFRALTLKLSKAQIPMLVTNHTYQGMGMFATKEMSGGGGIKYAANNIIFLSKAKDKDKDGNVIGAKIRCKVVKSRITREQIEGTILLNHQKGLDKFYGLVDLALEANIFQKVSTKIKLPDGSSEFESKILANPEKFFTKDVLEQIDAFCKTAFVYGGGLETNPEELVEEMLDGK